MVSFCSCSRVIMASCFWSLYEVQSFLGLCQRSQYWCASTPLPHALLLLVSPTAAAGARPRHHLLLLLRQPQLVQAQAIAVGTNDQWFSLLSIGAGNVQYRKDAIFWRFSIFEWKKQFGNLDHGNLDHGDLDHGVWWLRKMQNKCANNFPHTNDNFSKNAPAFSPPPPPK